MSDKCIFDQNLCPYPNQMKAYIRVLNNKYSKYGPVDTNHMTPLVKVDCHPFHQHNGWVIHDGLVTRNLSSGYNWHVRSYRFINTYACCSKNNYI